MQPIALSIHAKIIPTLAACGTSGPPLLGGLDCTELCFWLHFGVFACIDSSLPPAMNVTRTLLAARQAVRPHASPLAASTSVSAEAFIQQHSLPLSVQRYINRQVRLSGQAGGSVQMANPFINTWKPSPQWVLRGQGVGLQGVAAPCHQAS